jgi:hypothetical protein
MARQPSLVMHEDRSSAAQRFTDGDSVVPLAGLLDAYAEREWGQPSSSAVWKAPRTSLMRAT